jgi:RNA polymerase sigma factor (sigma-70 family)
MSRDDSTLWQAWRGGDRRAGEELFERYFDAIYRFFGRKIQGDVGDLVQRTFLGCVEARDRFREASSFRTFLFAIARNELCAYFRARKQNAALDFSVSSLAELSPSPSTMARQRSERDVLNAALRALPLDLQLAVELRFWENLSGPDLAVVLEIPEGTARSRLRRALEALRDALAAQEGGARLLGAPGEDLDAWAARLKGKVGI